MSEQITLRQWTDVARRARLGRTPKAVALMLATYADADGTRVFPGVARLSHDCEIAYSTVKKALAKLRKAGLIKVVGRRGEVTEYRLILAEDLLERCDVPSPAAVEVEVGRIRSANRGDYVPSAATQRAADGGMPDGSAATGIAAEMAPAATGGAADTSDGTDPAATGVAAETDLRLPGELSAATGVAATYQDHYTTTTAHSDDDLRTAAHPPRARAPVDDQTDSVRSEVDRARERIAAASAGWRQRLRPRTA